ncbi:MAG: hypothetical protein AABY13_00870, partial [Nanoarchaeota archaeon]
ASRVGERRTATLIEENSILAGAISSAPTDSNLSILRDHLDEARIVRLSKMNYTDVKRELGLVTDFCIYFTDERGNFVDIGGVRFLGSPTINVTLGKLLYACDGTLLTLTQCNDKLDNELPSGDLLIDMDDPDCQDPSDDTE